MKITYWSDYACPFCFIGDAKLKKAIANLQLDEPIEWEMKAFQLDLGAPLDTNITNLEVAQERYHVDESQARERMAGMIAMAEEEGLDFRYETAYNTNTFDAHRLTKYAQQEEPEKSEELIQKLYKAYFTENLMLADHEVLKEVANEVGLKEDRVNEVLDSDGYADVVREEEYEASSLGVREVPFYIIGKYGVSGAQPVEYFEEVLKVAQSEAKLDALSQGQACGIDGCDA